MNHNHAEAQTPQDIRDIRNAVEHRLFRGQAIANVLRSLVGKYEDELRVDDPFTLDFRPCDLRIVLEVLADELETAHAVLSRLAPTEL